MATSIHAIEVFFSYCHRDEELREELCKHLSCLQRRGVITEWHDRMIGPGTGWEGQIDEHLESARIILLLISADFMASDYCYDIEMKRALQRHDAREAVVIPVILRDCDLTGAPFSRLQGLPKGFRPITSWENRDEAYTSVAKGIGQVADLIRKSLDSGAAPGSGLARLSAAPASVPPGVAAPVASTGGRPAAVAAPPPAAKPDWSGLYGPAASPAPPPLDSSEVKRAARALAEYIGPIAMHLAPRVATRARSLRQLYKLLAAEIESEPDRRAFLAAMPADR